MCYGGIIEQNYPTFTYDEITADVNILRFRFPLFEITNQTIIGGDKFG